MDVQLVRRAPEDGAVVHRQPLHVLPEVDHLVAHGLLRLARGADLVTCAQLGSLAAAEVISHLGARPQESLRKLADAAGLP